MKNLLLENNKFYTFKDSIDRIFIFKCKLSICGKIVYKSNGWCLINNKYFINVKDTSAFISNNDDLSPKQIDIKDFFMFLPDNHIDRIVYLRNKKIKILLNE